MCSFRFCAQSRTWVVEPCLKTTLEISCQRKDDQIVSQTWTSEIRPHFGSPIGGLNNEVLLNISSLLRPISTFLNWLHILKPMQPNWLKNMTVFSALSLIFMPYWLPKRSPPSLLNHGSLRISWEFKRHHWYLKCTWRRNLTALNRSRLTTQTNFCNRQMSNAKSAHYSEIIADPLVIIAYYGRHSTQSLHRCFKSQSFIYWYNFHKNLHHSLFFLLWLMLKCVESSWYQEGLTDPNWCHQWWGALSCSDGSMQVIWLRPNTYCIDIPVKPITSTFALWRFLPFTLKAALVSPLLKSLPSERITWKLTSQCPFLVSFPMFLRKLWIAV